MVRCGAGRVNDGLGDASGVVRRGVVATRVVRRGVVVRRGAGGVNDNLGDARRVVSRGVVALRRSDSAVGRRGRVDLDDGSRVAPDGTVGHVGSDAAVSGRAGVGGDGVGRSSLVEDGTVRGDGDDLGVAVGPGSRGSSGVSGGLDDLGVGGVERARGTDGNVGALFELGAGSSGGEEVSLGAREKTNALGGGPDAEEREKDVRRRR